MYVQSAETLLACQSPRFRAILHLVVTVIHCQCCIFNNTKCSFPAFSIRMRRGAVRLGKNSSPGQVNNGFFRPPEIENAQIFLQR